MACVQFKRINFSEASRERIDLCNTIIDEHLAQGFKLSLRQVYYQLVARGAIPNNMKSYKNLGSLISDARLGGLIDWEAIEDREREPWRHPQFNDLADLAEAALDSYRLPRWADQDYYVELWVEKRAQAGTLRRIAEEFHVTMLVNRGYSSQTALYEAAHRFNQRGRGKERVLLYLGDHDPSGEDMVRDIEDRLALFGVVRFDVRKIALTWAQIQQYQPPPNPAKLTDSRAAEYIKKHGNDSWELDALPPSTLMQIMRRELKGLVDKKRMDAVIAQEEKDKERLRAAVGKLVQK
jgi:hypothetical protein